VLGALPLLYFLLTTFSKLRECKVKGNEMVCAAKDRLI